jgi:hypothetical protein
VFKHDLFSLADRIKAKNESSNSHRMRCAAGNPQPFSFARLRACADCAALLANWIRARFALAFYNFRAMIAADFMAIDCGFTIPAFKDKSLR